MNKLAGIISILIITLTACQQEPDYKAVRDDVMKFHDVVMADHGIIVNNEMKLDTLIKELSKLKKQFPEIDTLKEKNNIKVLRDRLTKAEDSMNDWMHAFEPDVSGKNNAEAIKYFKDEKARIAAIDSIYKLEIKASTDYLTRFRKP